MFVASLFLVCYVDLFFFFSGCYNRTQPANQARWMNRSKHATSLKSRERIVDDAGAQGGRREVDAILNAGDAPGDGRQPRRRASAGVVDRFFFFLVRCQTDACI